MEHVKGWEVVIGPILRPRGEGEAGGEGGAPRSGDISTITMRAIECAGLAPHSTCGGAGWEVVATGRVEGAGCGEHHVMTFGCGGDGGQSGLFGR